MEKLEKEFESMLVNTNNAELISKYADLKEAIYKTLNNAIQALEANEQLSQKAGVAKTLSKPDVSGSFSQKDMENFAAKCMFFGHQGKTTSQLLKEFCDNDR